MEMRKFWFSLALFIIGMLGVIALLIASMITPLSSSPINGEMGCFAVLSFLNMMPTLFIFLLMAVCGLVLCIKESFMN